MIEDILVSVIVPVFQGEALIGGALRSVLAQTHQKLEIIVVDDGSTDKTLEVVNDFEDPRVLLISQSNSGTATARNAAMARARGMYIAFLDADDRWFPEKIAQELRVLHNVGVEPAIAYSSYFAVDERGRLLNLAPVQNHYGNAFDVLLDGEDFLMPSVCLFDRRIFDKFGVFNPASYHEDHEFIMRVARSIPIFPTRERLVVYRQSTGGKCRSILDDFDRARSEELTTLELVGASLSEGERTRFRDNLLRSLSSRFLMYGFNANARRLLREIDPATLRVSKKGWLTWLFARSGINLLQLARNAIQFAYLSVLQPLWQRRLRRARLRLGYE